MKALAEALVVDMSGIFKKISVQKYSISENMIMFLANTHVCALKVYIGSTSREALLKEVQENVNMYTILYNALQKSSKNSKFLKSVLPLLKSPPKTTSPNMIFYCI